MANILTKKGEIAIKAIKEFQDTGISKKALGKYLFNKHPDVYSSAEQARNTIRVHTGAIGGFARAAIRKIHKFSPTDSKNIRPVVVAEDSPQYKEAKKRKFDKTKKRFIVTWGQNATPVHSGFYKNMEAYAKYIGADIHIVLGRYKNPTSTFSDSDQEYWVKEVDKYKDANRHNIHKYLSLLSDIKIQPTAINPMSGLAGVSGANSCIFGSPKVQMETVPVLEGNVPKMMLTTGACTMPNYTDSKAGKKGEFHHVFGFCVVEIKDKDVFFVRQVTADTNTGDFYDLYWNVSKGRVSRIREIEAIVLGDMHYGKEDKAVCKSRLKMLSKIRPKHVVIHDVFDGDSINPHTIKDAFIQYGKEINGTNDLQAEIDNMLKELKVFTQFKNVAIISSNHNDFLDRWLRNEDWKKTPTPKNFKLYMQYASILLDQHADNTEKPKGVIATIINERYPQFKTIGRSDSYKVAGWELGQHGDIGSGGSRGSLNQLRKLNTKTISGHSHAPGRKDGALAVGTSTVLRVGYNIGASSWLQSDIIIHHNGKAQHVNYINAGFTTMT